MPGKLAGIIRSKYPGAYDDMDDATLETSVLAKYPQYADLAKDDGPQAVSPDEPGTFAGGFIRSLKQQAPEYARSALNALPGVGALVGGVLSTPETFGAGTVPGIALGAGAGRGLRDLIGHYTGLDKPTTPQQKALAIGGETAIAGATAAILPGVVSAVKAPMQTLREGAEQFGSAMPPAIRRLAKIMPSLPEAEAGPLLQRPAWQTWPQETPADLSQPVRAGSLTQQEIADRVAAVRANGGLPPQTAGAMPKVRGVIRTTAQPAAQAAPAQAATEAATVAPESVAASEGAALPESWKSFASVKPEASMRQPRVQVGAEKVGRGAGMTKEEVRQEVGPLFGETHGEASPILPQEPLKRIIDTMKAMPPGEREAYVAKATAGKTRGQIENIRRTLEHLGLLVAAPVAGGAMLREAMMERMRGEATTSSEAARPPKP